MSGLDRAWTAASGGASTRLASALTAQSAQAKRGGVVARVLQVCVCVCARAACVLRTGGVVVQLDAQSLDDELANVLLERVQSATSLLSPEAVERLRPELEAAVHALVFALSTATQSSTPGLAMMNLRLRDERAVPPSFPVAGHAFPITRVQRALLGVLTVLVPYLFRRLQLWMVTNQWAQHPEGEWRHKAWRLAHHVDTATTALRVLNFLVFLNAGVFRSVAERVLGVRATYVKPQHNRLVSFELLNQQLLWGTLTELARTVVPLLQLHRLQRMVARLVRAAPKPSALSSPSAPRAASFRPCVSCGAENPAMPHTGGACGCVYCYVCVHGVLAEGTQPTCVGCGEALEKPAWALPAGN